MSPPASSLAGGDPPPATRYRTQWRTAGNTWVNGPELGLGYTWDPGHQIPQPYVLMAGNDCTRESTLHVDGNGALVITIDLSLVSDVVCNTSPGVFIACTAALSNDGTRFTGHVSQTCTGAVEATWQGEWMEGSAAPIPLLRMLLPPLSKAAST